MIHEMEIRYRLAEIKRKQDWADCYAWAYPRLHYWW
ncbi:hypothetical protein JOE21_002262 [Desmospora profundinema]|uniref:Uncharacterized protein n=1 Tax=Desmospora profundinema TaxID=1571184 RepID=A0ABU1IN96_9BACL|nr:hypothetical protein [Desmospora profundinema]